MTIRKVFISSTARDLVKHRLAVYEAIEGLDGYHAVRMEDFGARDLAAREFSLQKVAESDLFTLIMGHLYGSIPPGSQLSYTEQEYQTAVERGLPCLVFVASEGVPLPASLRELDEKYAKQQAFRERVMKEQIVDFFDTPEDLARRVIRAIRNWEQGVEISRPLSTFLTYQEFVERTQHAALVGHEGALVGRQTILSQIHEYLQGETGIIVIHGSGGIGKTRLLLALPDTIPEDIQLWYTRTEAETIEHDLAALDRNRRHVIVVDDAHRFTPLLRLREVLINPDYAGKVKLILSTRSVFRAYVAFRFPQMRGDQITHLELAPLTNSDVDHLLQNAPCNIVDGAVRRTLIALAEGNPLVAQIGARLVRRGADVAGLTRDEVLTRYFDELIHDLADAGYDDRYVCYLEILAALGTLDMGNEALRQRVQEVVGISPVEEERIVASLVHSGLVEQYWKTLKIASEVLADHILVSHFFDPKTRRADYQKQIIEPFLPLKAKEILTNLAEAEVKGESHEAGILLGRKLDELYQTIDGQENIARLAILDWLQDVAYLKADETLAIVARIVDSDEHSTEVYRDRWLGVYEISHDMVLDKAVEIVSRCKYGALRDAIAYLHKLARYRPDEPRYSQVRERARKALAEIAEFRPRQPYVVQLTLLDAIPRWLAQDFAGNLDLVLAFIKPMLAIELHSAETDPTEPFRVVVRYGLLDPTKPLRQIREQALGILYAAYHQATSTLERFKIIKALDGAVPPSPPDIRVPEETREWLWPDCANTAHFFSDVVIEQAELPGLDAISTWLWRARRWAGYDDEALDRLSKQLKSHQLYQLYRLLIGWDRWDGSEPDEGLDWRRAEQHRQEEVQHYLSQLKPDNFAQTILDLSAIASQSQSVGETGVYWLNWLLQRLGEDHPNLAQQLIEHTVAKELALKKYLGPVIAGLRKSASEIADGYLRSWTTGDDTTLWLAAAHSYRFVDWAQVKAEDWDILRQLAAHESATVDYEMVRLAWRYAHYNPDLAVETLKTIAARGDQGMLQHVAMVLSFQDDAQKDWAIQFKNPQDYLEIIQNFERLSQLDFHAERCLDRLGQIAPMHVIDFIEQRIAAAHERGTTDKRYDAVPFQFERAIDSIRSSTECPDVLRRVRDWMLRDDFLFRWETPHVLKAVSGGLGEPLYAVLMEWVQSGNVEKLRGAAVILREFNEESAFYRLSREIIQRTDDDAVLGGIAAAISSTPGVISGSMSTFYQKRLETLSPWLGDEDSRVRRFAHRMAYSLQASIEREEAEEAFERRNW